MRSNLLLSLATLGCLACASTGGDDSPEATAYDPSLVRATREVEIGVFLTNIDRTIGSWNHLKLTGTTPDDTRKVRGLEEDLEYQTARRRHELIEQLETGPPFNRQVSAVALGFTNSDEALSPLLAALNDPSIDVVSNALLGLAILRRSTTPLNGIIQQLDTGAEERVRVNAAYAARQVMDAGATTPPELLYSARAALRDPAAAVRSQCVLILAQLRDVDSIEAIELILYDDTPLVAIAAARALAYLGSVDQHVKGQCARALAAALSKVDRNVREGVLRSLRELSGANFGREAEDWLEWAHRLP